MDALEYFIDVRESVDFDEQDLEFYSLLAYATLILKTILFRHGISYPDS